MYNKEKALLWYKCNNCINFNFEGRKNKILILFKNYWLLSFVSNTSNTNFQEKAATDESSKHKKHHFHILKAINYPLCVLTFSVPILNSCRHRSSSIGNGTTLESIGCILVLYSATQLRKLMDDEKHFSLLLFLLRKMGAVRFIWGEERICHISRWALTNE